jgi:hypothetical protein
MGILFLNAVDNFLWFTINLIPAAAHSYPSFRSPLRWLQNSVKWDEMAKASRIADAGDMPVQIFAASFSSRLGAVQPRAQRGGQLIYRDDPVPLRVSVYCKHRRRISVMGYLLRHDSFRSIIVHRRDISSMRPLPCVLDFPVVVLRSAQGADPPLQHHEDPDVGVQSTGQRQSPYLPQHTRPHGEQSRYTVPGGERSASRGLCHLVSYFISLSVPYIACAYVSSCFRLP